MNDPAVECGHQVVTLGRRNELIRCNEFAVLTAHAEQQLVVSPFAPVLLADADNGLEKQLEAVLLHSARDARHPFHFLMPQRRVRVPVQVDLVTPHVLRGVTGHIR